MGKILKKKSADDLKIGLALGGGGAVGLAHIAILEVLDECGVRPHRIAGASIGSIIGALYASGKSGAEINQLVRNVVQRDTTSWKGRLFDQRLLKWIRFVDPELGEGGLVGGDAFIAFLKENLAASTFEELSIPLQVVTTDCWNKEAVIYDRGDLLKPIQASMAIPGLFSPVRIGDRVLMDGALTNPVPYDILSPDCDRVIAINVIGDATRRKEISFINAVHMGGRIMLHRQIEEKLARQPPDIYIDTGIMDIHVLQFHKFDEIYQQAQTAAERLRKELRELCSK